MVFDVEKTFWSCLPSDLAERVCSLLASPDLQHLRLVNHHWRQIGNLFITQQRPQTFQALLELSSAFSNLTSVDLSALELHNELQLKQAVTGLGQIPNLEQITLRSTHDLTLESLAIALPNLPRLSIRPGKGLMLNSEKDCCSEEAFPLTNLRLDLFSSLTYLDLSWNTLDSNVLHQISQLPKLEGLNLKNCVGVDDSLIESLIEGGGSIKSLNLSNTSVSDEGVLLMNDLPLVRLNLSKCDSVTDDGMFWMQYIRTLEELDISGCPEITAGGLEQLIQLPKLKRLYLQETKLKTGSLLSQFLSLEVLNLRDCCWVTDSILTELSLCKNLKFLNLRNCTDVTDKGLESLLQLPELQSINLRGCRQITDEGISILSSLPQLRDLDLSFLNQITDLSLSSLTKTHQLHRLVLNWCNQVTSTGLKGLKDHLQGLQELSIKGCHNMGSEDLVSMTQGSSIKKLDYEHSQCSVNLVEEGKRDLKFPMLKHIDSVGCFVGIC